jgi:site-specific recombinase XerD
MKKDRDLATYLTKFLSYYLPEIRNLSPNTISSYCDTFRLLLEYCRDVEEMKIEKLMISDLTSSLVERFLDWLIAERRIKDSTRNQRLAAIHSFVRYIQADFPEFLLEFCKILDIKNKKTVSKTVNWLTKEEMGDMLNAPNPTTKMGRRNITILTLLYDTGARVSEICDLRVRDIRLEHPAHARLFGKGRKARLVPLLPGTVKLLETHLKENRLDLPEKSDYPLFVNRDGNQFTRAGINYILNQASIAAAHGTGQPPKHCSPHMIRHTKAMHVYDAGANIVYVRDILGHADVKTTGVYARTSLEKKREALAKVSDTAEPMLPVWTKDPDMLDWLKDYGKIKK